MLKNILVSFVVALAVVTGAHFLFPLQGIGSLPSYLSTLDNSATFTGSKTQGQFSLGPQVAATSSATTTVNLSKGLNWGLAVGDQCSVQLSSMTSTAGFSADAFITSISATSTTSTVTYFNAGNAAVTIATGTLKVRCNHI